MSGVTEAEAESCAGFGVALLYFLVEDLVRGYWIVDLTGRFCLGKAHKWDSSEDPQGQT